MVASNPDGVDMVEESNGKYAFFMESSSIEYLIERRCKLAQVIGVVFHIFFRLDFLGRPFKNQKRHGHSPHNGFAPTPNCHIVGFVTHWLYVKGGVI